MAVTKIISGGKTHGALSGCINYVLREHKNKQQLAFLHGPFSEDWIEAKDVYEDFLAEKQSWNKDYGRMYYHVIVSFHYKENITAQEVLDFGIEYADRVFHDYQTLVVVHQNREHLHAHLVVNSVSFEDGHKFHSSKQDLIRMKRETDRMCEERNLTITQKGKTFENRNIRDIAGRSWDHYESFLFSSKFQKSYVKDCAINCIRAIRYSKDKEEFINRMQVNDWQVIWTDSKKHITFVNERGEKVRDSNISKKFNMDITKEKLTSLFERRSVIVDVLDELEKTMIDLGVRKGPIFSRRYMYIELADEVIEFEDSENKEEKKDDKDVKKDHEQLMQEELANLIRYLGLKPAGDIKKGSKDFIYEYHSGINTLLNMESMRMSHALSLTHTHEIGLGH